MVYNPAWCSGSTTDFDSVDPCSNRGAGTMARRSWIWNIDDAEFRFVVNDCKCIAEVVRRLSSNKVSDGGNTWHAIKARIKADGLYDRFDGKKRRGSEFSAKDADIFVFHSTTVRSNVRIRLIQNKIIPYVCAICKTTPEWLGKPLSLHLDHINGISNDHRIENLRFLCPNCHSQTETYCGRNTKRIKLSPVV